MNEGAKEIRALLEIENKLLSREQEFYLAAVTNVNLRTRELMKNDLGVTFVKNCAWDVADWVVDSYFNTSECYISAQQMYDRIVNFSYDNENDVLVNNSSMRERLYKSDSTVEVLNDVDAKCRESQEKLFVKEKKVRNDGKIYSEYVDKNEYINPGKENYKKELKQDMEILHDELTGVGEDELPYSLEVDHVQAAATATYNSRYLNSADAIDSLKKFYNSADNFQMLNKSANGSKGDVRVFSDGHKKISEVKMLQEKKEAIKEYKQDNIKKGLSAKEAEIQAKDRATQEFDKKYVDITYKATAEDLTQAVCDRWENANQSATENLKAAGVLDENGKVLSSVKQNLENNLKVSMNKESRVILQNLDYSEVVKDTLEPMRGDVKKIIAGQVVYYVLPPLVYETQCIVRKKNMTLDGFMKALPRIAKRVLKYVKGKLGEIFQNLAGNFLNSFLKNFFDIIIAMVKETVKRMLKRAKKLVISLVNCVNVLISPRSNRKEKADAITKILSTTITSILIEVLFEWAEKQFNLPDFLMEPLQIIVTILATNLIMLVLQKADLFDVQYGLLVSNIQMIFEDEHMRYIEQNNILMREERMKVEEKKQLLTSKIEEIQSSLKEVSLYRDNVEDDLNKINDIFDMGIDFNKEWNQFITV